MIFHRTMAGFLVELEDLAILAYLKLLVDQEESPYFIEKGEHRSILHVKVKKKLSVRHQSSYQFM